MKEIVIVGFGGHAKSVADSIESSNEYRILGYTDVKEASPFCRFRRLGNDDCLRDLYRQGVRYACIGVGYLGKGELRDKLYNLLKKIGFQLPVIVDPTAVIAKDVSLKEGTYVGKNAVINASSKIGKMCIVNSGVLIEHENMIGDFSHAAVRSVTCGEVEISDHCFLGANATVIQGIQVGKNVIVGAGAVVISDLPGYSVAVGNPAKVIKVQGGQL